MLVPSLHAWRPWGRMKLLFWRLKVAAEIIGREGGSTIWGCVNLLLFISFFIPSFSGFWTGKKCQFMPFFIVPQEETSSIIKSKLCHTLIIPQIGHLEKWATIVSCLFFVSPWGPWRFSPFSYLIWWMFFMRRGHEIAALRRNYSIGTHFLFTLDVHGNSDACVRACSFGERDRAAVNIVNNCVITN